MSRNSNLQTPILRFSPYAWAKLKFLRDIGNTEVGGYGIAFDPDELLTVNDIFFPEQICSTATTAFDMDSVAQFWEQQTQEEGRKMEQIARIWIHTHPRGIGADPSLTDEDTFDESFGKCDWSVMMILSKSEKSYARLQIRKPRISIEMKIKVDWALSFLASDHDAWREEYNQSIKEAFRTVRLPEFLSGPGTTGISTKGQQSTPRGDWGFDRSVFPCAPASVPTGSAPRHDFQLENVSRISQPQRPVIEDVEPNKTAEDIAEEIKCVQEKIAGAESLRSQSGLSARENDILDQQLCTWYDELEELVQALSESEFAYFFDSREGELSSSSPSNDIPILR